VAAGVPGVPGAVSPDCAEHPETTRTVAMAAKATDRRTASW
jgi:hypothetical protein